MNERRSASVVKSLGLRVLIRRVDQSDGIGVEKNEQSLGRYGLPRDVPMGRNTTVQFIS
jgi:hypothetical protein